MLLRQFHLKCIGIIIPFSKTLNVINHFILLSVSVTSLQKFLNDFALSRLVLSSMFRVTPGTKDTERHLGIDVVHENSRHRNDPFSDMISL